MFKVKIWWDFTRVSTAGFLSLNFWWWGLKIFGLPDGDEVGWGGGGLQKNRTEAKTAHIMQNYAIFCYFKHEIQLFKVLLSLKNSQIWPKNVFKFVKFSGTNLGWGGQALVQKRGQVSDGGIDKIFAGWGDPQSPQEKKTCIVSTLLWKLKIIPEVNCLRNLKITFKLKYIERFLSYWSKRYFAYFDQ